MSLIDPTNLDITKFVGSEQRDHSQSAIGFKEQFAGRLTCGSRFY